MAEQAKALASVERLKTMLRAESVQDQFENALQENRGPFVASLIDIYGNDRNLQKCDPKLVIMEALKAATLKLPINRQLGFAWIVPYNGVPQFQVGYRGYIQLAMRTGWYRYINADKVYDGELRRVDKLTGEIDLSGERKSDTVVGYFAHIETVNGFKKTMFWTTEQVIEHAKRYSKSYHHKDGAWQTNFDAMALKTMIRVLLSHYGLLSIEMIQAIDADRDEEEEIAREVAENANAEVIDINGEVLEGEAETGEEAPDGPPPSASGDQPQMFAEGGPGF